jgi:hypothetical protein
MLTIGFRYKKPVSNYGIGFVIATSVDTDEKVAIMPSNWHAFIIDNGYASANATSGACSVPAEVLRELGFNLTKGVAAVC